MVFSISSSLSDFEPLAIMAYIMYIYAAFPLWVIYIMIGRDLLILIGASFLVKKMDSIPSSEWPGKVASSFIALLFLAYVAEWDSVKSYLLIITVISIAYSFLDYILKFIKLSQRKPT